MGLAAGAQAQLPAAGPGLELDEQPGERLHAFPVVVDVHLHAVDVFGGGGGPERAAEADRASEPAHLRRRRAGQREDEQKGGR